tara:strand:- start:54 stop:182 length:129 start_codon:yes stop_codon:yes gene_type:complete
MVLQLVVVLEQELQIEVVVAEVVLNLMLVFNQLALAELVDLV